MAGINSSGMQAKLHHAGHFSNEASAQHGYESFLPGEVHHTGGVHEINHYHLSYYFELAVEVINSLAGMIVLCAVLLAGINLGIVLFNVATGESCARFRMVYGIWCMVYDV
ncbi:hypothetical protein EON64_16870 [archaeon]|nr:MAG: hypothetical protein EON64_16870 [archaeon]